MTDNTQNSGRAHSNSFSVFPTDLSFLGTDVFYGMSFARLDSNTVVSRTQNGEILSRLSSDEWILPAFAFHVGDNIYFNFLPFYNVCDHKNHNVETCKKLFIIKMFSKNLKSGRPLRLSTMHSTLQLLAKINDHCVLHNLKLESIFEEFDLFKNFQEELTPSMNKALVALVRTLNSIDSLERGFPLNGTIFPYMQKAAKAIRTEGKQFPIIPSRILLFKYRQYHAHIDDLLEHHQNLFALLDRAAENPYYGKSNKIHTNPNTRASKLATAEHLALHIDNPTNFKKAVQEYNLDTLCEKYQWKAIINVLGFITKVSHCAKSLIHLYTLMRDHEVKGLTTDCLERVKGWNNDALYVAGITTKLYSTSKPTKWITTDAILKPVDTLTKINRFLSPHFKTPNNHLLISAAVHPVANAKPSKDYLVKRMGVEAGLDPILITEADIQELEAVDPLRNWRSDPKYKIGAPWIISSHQFRRTMAVFCAQTGLITLPSLKRLLGHLTKVMSLYYTRGCSAQNYHFNLINPELAAELRRAKSEADGAMYIREALRTSEKLLGLKGMDISGQRSSSVWVDRAVAETVQLAAKGLAAYTEIPLGGCASPVPCDKRAHGNFFTCPGCRHLIGKKSVLDATLEIMKFDISELDSDSMEYKAEMQNLKDFTELRDRLIAKSK